MKKINHNSLCETETFEGGISDNYIKNALECCKDKERAKCKDCPLCNEETYPYCISIPFLSENALALINRQQAEIEKLKTEKDNLIRNYRQCMIEAIEAFVDRFVEEYSLRIGEDEEVDDIINAILKEIEEGSYEISIDKHTA